MEYRIVQTYVAHVEKQCRFIVMAREAMRAASAKIIEAHELHIRDDSRAGFQRMLEMQQLGHLELDYSIQGMLSAVANIHKTLFAGGGVSSEGRQPVRDALGVDDNSPISTQARDMRNNFDHMDERIERWNASGEGLMIHSFGAPPTISGHTEKVHWDGYDPATDRLSFWDQTVDVGLIEAEARRLIEVAEEVRRRCSRCMDEGKLHYVGEPHPRPDRPER